MIAAVSYAAASASSRAGLSQRLDADNWQSLGDANSLEEAHRALQQTAYAAILPPEVSAADEIERSLERHLSEVVYAPLPFLGGAAARLYRALWTTYEMEDLFIVLRGMHNNVPPTRIRRSLKPLGEPSTIDWRSLSGADSLDDLVRQLEETPSGTFYAKQLASAKAEYQRTGHVSVLETAVNLAQHDRLRRLVGEQPGGDRRDAETIVGTTVDAALLISAGRYAVFFDSRAEEIQAALPERGIRVQRGHLESIASGGGIVSIVEELYGLPEIAELKSLSPREQLVRMELAFLRHRHRESESILAGSPFGLGPLLAFVALMEDEVHDITTLVEAAVEGWDRKATNRQLVGQEV